MVVVIPSTEPGTRWLAAGLDWLAGERLTIGQVAGTATATLTLADVAVRYEDLVLDIERVQLSWLPAGLLDATLFITSIEAAGVTYNASARSPPKDEASPFAANLSLPVAVVVQSLSVERLIVSRAGEDTRVDTAQLSMTADASSISLSNLSVSSEKWRATLWGAVTPSAPYALNVRAVWTAKVEDSWRDGRLRIFGDTETVDFEAVMQAPFGLQTRGTVHRAGRNFRVDVSGDWEGLQWPLLGPPAVVSGAGQFTLRGDFDRFVLVMDGDIETDAAPLTHVGVNASGSIKPPGVLGFDVVADWWGWAGKRRQSSGPSARNRRHQPTRGAVVYT